MLKKNILLYFICLLLFLSIPNVVGLTFSKSKAVALSSDILSKDDTMLKAKETFFTRNQIYINCLFIGDSQTYQGIDPQLIDYYCKTSSYNFGGAAHWFETQYAQLTDLLPRLKPGTVIVWSIGHNNFKPSYYGYIPNSYPLSLRLALKYLGLGFSIS